jgi:nicotinamide phosphoribosyltransferase
MVYSNLTPRSSRTGISGVVAFGFQYFVEEYLRRQFSETFFDQPKAKVLTAYQRRVDNYLGPGAVTVDHIAALHDLGYLPLLIKAVPEGTVVPLRVPMLTIRNTVPEFFWLTNMLETLMSNVVWGPCTSATTAFEYRKTFERYAKLTGGPKEFVPWQGHDFSFRGLTGPETAMLSGAAHLLSFTGTDTVPAIDFLEEYYGADSDKELVGGSVPATEHSVMCMGMQDGERETFKRLLTETYPAGPLSVVSDTWDFWKVLTEYLPTLKAEILARDGKLIVRPDSGDPVKIICGDGGPADDINGNIRPEYMGAIEVLWNIFGGKINGAGYRELDPHIGLIYGEAITLERQEEILGQLKAKGFASTNVVFGIGSYTYQYVTRDTYGFAIKSTYGETKSRGAVPIFKDPITDSGLKKSARGLLRVDRDLNGELYVTEDVTWELEEGGVLQTIFENGQTGVRWTLAEIRERIESQL